MFEKASRLKLRFNATTGGALSVEDLWDLPLTSSSKRPNLDDLAIALDRELKDTNTASFVKKASKGDSLTKLKFDIVLRVIELRQAEAEAADTKRINAEKKQRLLELIAEKQDESLKGKSIDELQALVNGL